MDQKVLQRAVLEVTREKRALARTPLFLVRQLLRNRDREKQDYPGRQS